MVGTSALPSRTRCVPKNAAARSGGRRSGGVQNGAMQPGHSVQTDDATKAVPGYGDAIGSTRARRKIRLARPLAKVRAPPRRPLCPSVSGDGGEPVHPRRAGDWGRSRKACLRQRSSKTGVVLRIHRAAPAGEPRPVTVRQPTPVLAPSGDRPSQRHHYRAKLKVQGSSGSAEAHSPEQTSEPLARHRPSRAREQAPAGPKVQSRCPMMLRQYLTRKRRLVPAGSR